MSINAQSAQPKRTCVYNQKFKSTDNSNQLEEIIISNDLELMPSLCHDDIFVPNGIKASYHMSTFDGTAYIINKTSQQFSLMVDNTQTSWATRLMYVL